MKSLVVYVLTGLSVLLVVGCTSLIPLPSSGTWEMQTALLGPVVVCRGANFSSEPEDCNQSALSLPSLPAPEIHYAELRARAAELYRVEAARVVLKEVAVEYLTEANGIIRGWRSTASAGKMASDDGRAGSGAGPHIDDSPELAMIKIDLHNIRLYLDFRPLSDENFAKAEAALKAVWKKWSDLNMALDSTVGGTMDSRQVDKPTTHKRRTP